jgi:hypothetical protein
MIREFGEFYNNFENVAVHMKYGSTIGPIVGMVNTDAFEDEVSGFSQGMWATSYTNYPVNQALYPDSYVLKAAANFNTGYGDMVLYLFYIEVPL